MADDDSIADAAVVQIAGLAVSLAERINDPRVISIRDHCLRQMDGRVIQALLKIVASQSAGPTPDDRRSADREKYQSQWQETLQVRMKAQAEQAKRASELNAKVAEQLLKRLEDDGRTTLRTDVNDEGANPVPQPPIDVTSPASPVAAPVQPIAVQPVTVQPIAPPPLRPPAATS